VRVKIAQWAPYGTAMAVALVASEFTVQAAGQLLIQRIEKYYPGQAVMLVSVEKNGFRAYAYFQTHEFLALMQLDVMAFDEIDLTVPPVDDSELPF
jgi:hypothetical protein